MLPFARTETKLIYLRERDEIVTLEGDGVIEIVSKMHETSEIMEDDVGPYVLLKLVHNPIIIWRLLYSLHINAKGFLKGFSHNRL